MFPNSKLTPEAADAFLTEWGVIVAEVGQYAFDAALTGAIRQSEFFPSVALIRKCGGANGETRTKCEADAAWNMVREHNAKWSGGQRMFKGIDKTTGEMVFESAPRLPARVEYAVRAVGGLRAIDNVDMHGEPFMRREFNEAYERAEFAASYSLQLAAPQVVKQLCGVATTKSFESTTVVTALRPMPRKLTVDEVEMQRVRLQQQAAEIGQGVRA
jgi:hypothetical protein